MLEEILLLYFGKSIDDKKALSVIDKYICKNFTEEAENIAKSLILKHYTSLSDQKKIYDLQYKDDGLKKIESVINNLPSCCFVTIDSDKVAEISFVKSIKGYMYGDVVNYIDGIRDLIKGLKDTKFYLLLLKDRGTNDMDEGFDKFCSYISKDCLKVSAIMDITDTFRIELYEIKHTNILLS
ncbi:MAG: hypothetical protein ACP5LO_07405 [Calditerrivibrio sp.]|uniref:hypothetical protein n=1 Tax=Calditerrivibrio sp. TaxID=2792612 RepID=UPI003D14B2A4